MASSGNVDSADSIRILFVDDEPNQSELGKLYLEEADSSFRIDSISLPRQALEILRHQPYECVVSDYQMSEMNGIQLCAEIRRFSNIPFIIYTGRGSEEVASEAFAAGADDYVRKESQPIHYRVLAKRVRQVVERRRFEDLYRLSIEGNRDGFALIQGTDFLYINQAMAEMLGVKSPQDVIGHSILRWVVEMERDLIKDRALRRQRGEEEPRVYEYRIRRADGEVRTLEASVSLINYRGKPVSLVFNHDVTERKRDEEALIEGERRLNRSQEMAHLGSWELDLASNRLYWSDEVYRIFGLKPQEFGATYEAFLDAVHPDDRKLVDTAYSSSLREGRDTYEIEHRVVRKSTGETRYVREKCEHIRDETGKIIRSIGMVHDVTEQKNAEQELRALNLELKTSNAELASSNEDLRSTEEELRSTNEQLVTISDKLRASRDELKRHSINLESQVEKRTIELRRSEEKLRESLQYTRSLIEASLDPLVTISLAGKITDVNEATVQVTGVPRKKLIGSDFSDYFTDPDKAREGYLRVFSEGSVRDYPLTIRNSSGNVTEVLYHATLYRNPSGEVQGVFAAARDVTNRRRAEENLREAEKMISIGNLTAMLAHDLRNPLNFIVQASELARKRPDRADRMLELIRENGERSLAMIEDLRSVTREVNLRKEDTNLNSLLRKVAEETRVHDNVTLRLDSPDDFNLSIDPGLIRRVLENLVTNALEAMPNGGALTIRTRSQGERTLIEVEDTGNGIPEEAIPHLFDPFFTTKSKGVGLGLTFVKKIVEAHGGYLTFKTKASEGTTFTVSLPQQVSAFKNS